MKHSTWIGTLALLAGIVAPPGLVGSAFGYGLLHDNAVTETVYVAPVSSVVATSYVVPTSYYVPTRYYLPTSYYVPTTYVSTYLPTTYTVSPTAYVVPTTYYTSTRYVTRRPVYTTTAYYSPTVYYSPTTYYVPSSYYVPTVYDYPVETSLVCDDATPTVRSKPSSNGTSNGSGSKATQSTRNAERPPQSITSSPIGDGSRSRERAASAEVPPNEVEVPENPSRIDSGTPPAPAPAAPPNEPAAGGNVVPPPAPVREPAKAKADAAIGEGDLPLPPDAPQQREARKPVVSPAALANILSGVVEAKRTSAFVPGVRITLTNRLRTFPDRVAESDALGRFAIRLFDGDWSVKVEAKDGRDVEVKRITVSGGQITDEQGREVPSLIIRR